MLKFAVLVTKRFHFKMRIICVLLSLLLGGSLCSPLSGDSSSKRGRLKLTDLNVDVLFIITKEFLLEDLLNLAMSHNNFVDACSLQFKRKYQHRSIAIMKNEDSEQKFVLYENCIEIFDIQMALNIWKCFGHQITSLRIQNYEIFNTCSDDVNEIFDITGAPTLNHLDLDVIKENTFERFTLPFKNVLSLHFEVNSKFNNVQFGSLSLPEIFPHLNCLNVELRKNINYNFLVHTYPNLEDVFISVTPSSWKRRAQIEAFLKKNPHIKRFRIDGNGPPSDYIKNIHQMLPRIESLTIEEIEFKDKIQIQFNNVIHFKLYGVFPGSITKVFFPRLQSLEMQLNDDCFDDWRTFLQKHNRITHLSVTQADGLKEMRLTELTTGLTELKEIVIDCNTLMKGPNILKFLKSHKKLVNFTMTFLELGDNTHFEESRKRLGIKWNLRYRGQPMKTLYLEKDVNATDVHNT